MAGGFSSTLLVLGAVLTGCADEPGPNGPNTSEMETTAPVSQGRGCSWSQWGQSAAHDGQACVAGQAPTTTLDHIVYDPFEFQEMAEGGGDLFIHYQVPLNDDDGNFYMMHKGGTYTPCDPPGSGTPSPCGIDQANIVKEIWSEKRYQRRPGGSFEEKWTFETDWKPFPVFLWEPMFQPALSGPILYVPGAGGSVWQVLTIFDHAVSLQRINPFPTVDPNTYVTSGVTVDRFGFLYWNVLQHDPDTFENRGFLVKAAPWGKTWKVDYETLIPGAPAEFDSCFYPFFLADPLPTFSGKWPDRLKIATEWPRADQGGIERNRQNRRIMPGIGFGQDIEHRMRRDSRSIPGVIMADIWIRIRRELQKR
jgi:hypothetical protein